MLSPQPPQLRPLHAARVLPSPPPPPRSLPLTFYDVLWLNAPPVERVFFYRLDADADVPRLLSNLKASLSEAVLAFFPLAGRLRLAPGTANQYEVFYEPGDGVAFTAVEYDVDIDELVADEAKGLSCITPLVPRLPEGGAVFAVQATVLLARRGIAVGVTVHHAACDGAGSTHFVHTWAAACAGVAAPPPPVIDRTLIADPDGIYDLFCRGLPKTEEMELVKMPDKHVLATFILSRGHLQSVKDVVAGEAARRGGPPPRCSTMVATYGFIWSCCQQAKATLPGSTVGTERTYLIFPVDHRTRRQPPVPDRYLGNCVGPAIAAAPKNDLVAAGAEGLFVSCAAIAAAIDEAVGGELRDGKQWMPRFKEVSAAGVALSVAGSNRFRVYEVDFGFGKPAKVDIVSVARTGAMAVAERRGGGDGIEVGISLPPAGMERFRTCFDDGIGWLSSPRS